MARPTSWIDIEILVHEHTEHGLSPAQINRLSPGPFDHHHLGILLKALLAYQGVGQEEAEKWPMGHTPIELHEVYRAWSKARWRETELQPASNSDIVDGSNPEHPGPQRLRLATPSPSRSERRTTTW